MKKYIAIFTSVGIILGISTGAWFLLRPQTAPDAMNAEASDAPSLIDKSTLESLEVSSASKIDLTHVDKNLTPPTNKWFSGMVLQREPKPGFSVPNSTKLLPNGFEMSLPSIRAEHDGVYGPHKSDMRVTIDDARSFKLTRYDELTITTTYFDEGSAPLFTVTTASGSPYVFIRAKKDIKVSVSGEAKPSTQQDGAALYKTADTFYGVKAATSPSKSSFVVKQSELLSVFSAPNESVFAEASKYALHEITSADASYDVRDNEVRTTLAYRTRDNKPTLLVRMPHQQSSDTKTALRYRSLYGELDARVGREIVFTQPLTELKWSLPVKSLPGKEQEQLRTQLRKDIENTNITKDDTYFAGKELQRIAQLAVLADELDENALRDQVVRKLRSGLERWFDDTKEHTFTYDPTVQSIVGRPASFGSDKEMNDHHFHYGHFIYAASVAAKYDAEFVRKYKNKVNLLVADIANYKEGEALPIMRTFDPYAGHSWASGLVDYTDGNNQESSSEAVNAWTGVGLWAQVTKNRFLEKQATWMLSSEVDTAQRYYLKKPDVGGFTAPFVSINWGAKREYKTFFSNEPNAKLAIQLLPLNPTMQAYVSTLPRELWGGTKQDAQYGDYVSMADPAGSRELKELRPPNLDDGNTLSYMWAYQLTIQNR